MNDYLQVTSHVEQHSVIVYTRPVMIDIHQNLAIKKIKMILIDQSRLPVYHVLIKIMTHQNLSWQITSTKLFYFDIRYITILYYMYVILSIENNL